MDPPGVDAASAGLYNGSLRMIPMEMDEEMDSLMHETGDFSGVVSKLTHRKKIPTNCDRHIDCKNWISRLASHQNCLCGSKYCIRGVSRVVSLVVSWKDG
jgi:hypothetical protein